MALRPFRASQSSRARPTLAGQAKATLGRVQYATGIRLGAIELSPRMTREERHALGFWIGRLPASFTNRLPPLKLAVADELCCVGSSVFVNGIPNRAGRDHGQPRSQLHAASYIPQRYVVLHRSLFRRRVELGRILYHELCHFLWPRLGNSLRKNYAARLRAEFDKGARGELGHSAQWRKEKLLGGQRRGASNPSRDPFGKLRAGRKRAACSLSTTTGRLWREYLCESFCDTGSYVLLGSERRTGHSEYTLSRAAREQRKHWMVAWGIGSGE